MQNEFKRLYLGEWLVDPEYDRAFKAWQEYYAVTDEYDSVIQDPGARSRFARERFKALLQRLQEQTDPKTFRRARDAALDLSERDSTDA